MLDSLAIIVYPGRIAAIEMHTRMYADTILYSLEAYQRWQSLPGEHHAPQLYIDGHRHPSWYWEWEDSIVARMNQNAPVAITVSGLFNPTNGQGSVSAQYRNDSTAIIQGRVMFVIVEDSIYFMDSLGGQKKEWHNHTARDYIPGPLGMMVTIAPNDSMTYTQAFTIPPDWRYNYCSIITFIQDTIIRPDTVTQNIWQGTMIRVSQLVGVDEQAAGSGISNQAAVLVPNPCVDKTNIAFNLPARTEYQISFFDVTGRLVGYHSGLAHGGQESVIWNCRDQENVSLSAGVYIWLFESKTLKTTGKLVVR